MCLSRVKLITFEALSTFGRFDFVRFNFGRFDFGVPFLQAINETGQVKLPTFRSKITTRDYILMFCFPGNIPLNKPEISRILS